MSELEMLLAQRKILNEKIKAARNAQNAIFTPIAELKRVCYPSKRVDWKLVLKSKTSDFEAKDGIGYRNASITLSIGENSPDTAINYLKEINKSIADLISEAEKKMMESEL